MSTALYSIIGLVHRYGQLPALDIPQMDIAQGSAVGLAGPNGSGKSTLLRILAFLEAPSQGQVLFQSAPRNPDTPGARQGITLLLQEPYLLRRGVAANLAYGLKLRGKGGVNRKDLAQALEWVGLEPETFFRRRWYQLSGGEAKRVALAARLVLKPRVLLLDEPTAGVDAQSAELLRQAALRARAEWGSTLVVASHDLHWLGRTVDQVRGLAYGQLQVAAPALGAGGVSREIPLQALHPQAPLSLGPGRRAVPARVTGLVMEPPPGLCRVELSCQGQTLAARLALEDLRGLCLSLGQEVWLTLEDHPV